MSKDTQTTIIGIATLVATIAQLIAQFFGQLDSSTVQTTLPLTGAVGTAVLGYKVLAK